jgi:cell division protein FtsL
MVLRSESKSFVIVLLVAALLIVSFIVIFSAKHKWDINEQRFRELKSKMDK